MQWIEDGETPARYFFKPEHERISAILLLRSILDSNDVGVFTREEIFHKFLTQIIERDQMLFKNSNNFPVLSYG